ncbi:MAG: RpoL/Rpb11 RNA polymerase subunit family protein [Candidatus Nanoarchaeia archaeon]
MEVRILEEKKNRMVVELKGEGHGYCNALKKALWRVKGVTVSGYNLEHPLISHPKVVIETDGKKDPKEALIEATKIIDKDCAAFQKAFDKQVK